MYLSKLIKSISCECHDHCFMCYIVIHVCIFYPKLFIFIFGYVDKETYDFKKILLKYMLTFIVIGCINATIITSTLQTIKKR